MASFKQNMGMIRDCLALAEVVPLLKAHGIPEDMASGIADVDDTSSQFVTTLLTVRSEANVTQLDRATKARTKVAVKKDTLYVFRLFPHAGTDRLGHLEVFDGGGKSVDVVGGFLMNNMLTNMKVDVVTLDLMAAFNRLKDIIPDARLRSAKVSGFRHEDGVVGPFSPRFATNEDGLTFVDNLPSGDDAKSLLKAIGVDFKIQDSKLRLTIAPDAAFRINCKPEIEDAARDVVRYIAGVPQLHTNSAMGGAS